MRRILARRWRGTVFFMTPDGEGREFGSPVTPLDEMKNPLIEMRHLPNILLTVGASGFLAVTFVIPEEQLGSMSSVCWMFALIPGLVALANHNVTLRQRAREDDQEASKHQPNTPEELAAALLLTTVFLIVARAKGQPNAQPNGQPNGPLESWVYAGYGAYISTLWYMLVRLNANALSPRFLINSALKVSIAVYIGYIASQSDLLNTAGKSAGALYFAIGLFHSWAMRAMKKTAMTMFGIAPAWLGDTSLASIDGIDEDAADVLQEIGITSAQHLATMRIPEVCGRTLYPHGRILDWIDQAILVVHTNGRIRELRAIGIHSAHALVAIAAHLAGGGELQQAARERLDEGAKRLGISYRSLLLVAECIKDDPAYKALLIKKHKDPPPDNPPGPPDKPMLSAATGEMTVRAETSPVVGG